MEHGPFTSSEPEQLQPPQPQVEGYEHLPPPPIEGLVVEEGRTALDGVRDFLADKREQFVEWRASHAEQQLDSLKAHDHVIRRAAGDALTIRSFGSEPETSDVMPIGRIQRITAKHREKQVAKIRHAQRETQTIVETYGEKGPIVHAYGIVPERSEQTYSSRDAERWNKGLDKQIKKDQPLVPSFDTNSRMRPSHRKAVKRQSQEYAKLVHHREHTEDRLERGEHRETLPGQIRRTRIARAQRKFNRLQDRAMSSEVRGRDVPKALRDLLDEQ